MWNDGSAVPCVASEQTRNLRRNGQMGPHALGRRLKTIKSKSRSVVLLAGFLASFCISFPALALDDIGIASPGGNVQLAILLRDNGRLSYGISFKQRPVVEMSPMGIVVDDVDLGQGVAVEKVDRYRLREAYSWRGVHSKAMNHCNGAK